MDVEQQLTGEQERDRGNQMRRRELIARIDALSLKSFELEKHQSEMEREIFTFMEENDRMRRALYNRDLEAQRAKQRNRQIIERSEFYLRKSSRSRSPGRSVNI